MHNWIFDNLHISTVVAKGNQIWRNILACDGQLQRQMLNRENTMQLKSKVKYFKEKWIQGK